MAPRTFDLVLHCLRRVAGAAPAPASTDRQLLQQFLEDRDEAAFESLVQRHGAMVLGVCRRALGNSAEAEDAFQATFLVLVRRAASLAWHDSIGGWLHQVAVRVALRARAVRGRQQAMMREVGPMQIIDGRSEGAAERQDLRRLLDEELDQLPARYREPLVLCYLEGKTHEEAAVELGCPRGSMTRRLDRARDLLRDRLAGRGLALPAGVAALLAAEQAATASVPPPLLEATVRTAAKFAAGGVSGPAASLAEGVIRAMVLNKLMTMVALAAVLILFAGGLGLFLQSGQAADPVVPAVSDSAAPAGPRAAPAPTIKPYVVWSGLKSGIRDAGYRRVTSANEWSKLWEAHSASDVPAIDFDQCMVVAVFQGPVMRAGVKFESATEDKEALTIRFSNESYQVGGVGTPPAIPTSYGLFVLPRSAKALILEENVQPERGGPPIWKLRVQIDGQKIDPVTATKEPVEVTPAGIEKRLQEIANAKIEKDSALPGLVREAAQLLLSKKDLPPDRFEAPPLDDQAKINDFKNRVAAVQMQIGLVQFKLDSMLEELDSLKDDRAKAPALWQTYYDYVRARLSCQVAYYYEYNNACGQLRKELPEFDPKLHAGWRLVPHPKLLDRDAAKYARQALDHLRLIARENAGNPWEEVAKGELPLVDSGLKWEAYPKKP